MGRVVRYSPVVYPFKLWIADELKEEEFKKRWEGNVEWRQWKYAVMRVIGNLVMERRSEYIGFILIVGDVKEDDMEKKVGYICHEASHLCELMWEHLGEDEIGNEANAYLMGWIGRCIYNFMKG